MTLIYVAAGSLLAATACLSTGDDLARADNRHLILEVILNGRPTGRVGEFVERCGSLYARPSELRDLGFAPPVSISDDPIPLSAIPDLRAQVDEASQTLIVAAGDSALQATEIRSGTSAPLEPLTVSEFGSVLNYDVLATATEGRVTGGALIDGRVFGRYGVLESTGVANFTPHPDQRALVRLDTTYTFSEPGKMRRWRAGDVISGALPWSRAVRLGGIQVSSDFNLRPDLITYPLPTISSSVAVPSTVDVFVNGVRQYSQEVQPGPFVIRTLPVVTGSGEVAVAVADAVGRQTLVALPFYASTMLLRPGLVSYSAELGAVRRDYGLSTDRYVGWAANGSLRYGASDQLTLEAHGEATDGLALAGIGVAWRISSLGVVNASVSASRGQGGLPVAGRADGKGAFVSIGFERRSREFDFSFSASRASSGYRDLATANGAPAANTTLSASFGRQLGPYGSVGVAYVSRRSRAGAYEPSPRRPGEGVREGLRTELVTLGYSVPIASRFTLRASGFKDLRRSNAYGIGLGVSMAFGMTYTAAGASLDNGRSSTFVQAVRPAFEPGDLGYQARATTGAGARRTASAEYHGHWGRVSAGLDHSSDGVAARTGARGALVWMGGGLFASDQVHDSFAVVRTGSVAGIPVHYENRLAGTTNSRGLLLVPSLLSYQNNRLSLDSDGLPADVEVGQTSRQVRPPDRSGILVDFQVVTVSAAVLTLLDIRGAPIPIGSTARIKGQPDRPVGYDGQVYITGLEATNQLVVVLPDGGSCTTQFNYWRVQGDIPQIGPFTCR